MKLLSVFMLSAALCFGQEGLIKEYHDNGKVRSEITYLNSKRDGEAKFYSEDGTLLEERPYVNGKVEGFVKIYTPAGKLKETFIIEDGKRTGPVSVYDDSGAYVADLEFYEGKRVVEPLYPEPAEDLAAAETGETDAPAETAPAPKKIIKRNDSPLPPVEDDRRVLEDDPAYYQTVEIMPEPIGGYELLQKKVSYPHRAKEAGIEGTVKLKAFITKTGKVEKLEVVEGLGFGTDEAARIAVTYTRFKPGMQRGVPVNVQMIIPVEFKLPD